MLLFSTDIRYHRLCCVRVQSKLELLQVVSDACTRRLMTCIGTFAPICVDYPM